MPGGAAAAAGKPGRIAAGAAKRAGGPTTTAPPAHVVGRVSPNARLAGVLGVAGAVCLLVRPLLPLVTSDGRRIGSGSGVLLALCWLPAAGIVAAAGVAAVRGRLPRLALGVIAGAGGLSIGPLLHWIWLTRTADRSVLDLPLPGQTLPGNQYTPGPGLVLAIVGSASLVAALLAVLAGWSSTVMEDDGRFDRARPAVAMWGLFVGALTAVSFGSAPSGSRLHIAPAALLQRSGLDLLGLLLLAAATVLGCVIAATLRPRLATVGTLTGLAVVLLGLGLDNLVVVAGSRDLSADFGTVAQLVTPLLVALLAVAAGVIARTEPADRISGEGWAGTADGAAV